MSSDASLGLGSKSIVTAINPSVAVVRDGKLHRDRAPEDDAMYRAFADKFLKDEEKQELFRVLNKPWDRINFDYEDIEKFSRAPLSDALNGYAISNIQQGQTTYIKSTPWMPMFDFILTMSDLMTMIRTIETQIDNIRDSDTFQAFHQNIERHIPSDNMIPWQYEDKYPPPDALHSDKRTRKNTGQSLNDGELYEEGFIEKEKNNRYNLFSLHFAPSANIQNAIAREMNGSNRTGNKCIEYRVDTTSGLRKKTPWEKMIDEAILLNYAIYNVAIALSQGLFRCYFTRDLYVDLFDIKRNGNPTPEELKSNPKNFIQRGQWINRPSDTQYDYASILTGSTTTPKIDEKYLFFVLPKPTDLNIYYPMYHFEWLKVYTNESNAIEKWKDLYDIQKAKNMTNRAPIYSQTPEEKMTRTAAIGFYSFLGKNPSKDVGYLTAGDNKNCDFSDVVAMTDKTTISQAMSRINNGGHAIAACPRLQQAYHESGFDDAFALRIKNLQTKYQNKFRQYRAQITHNIEHELLTNLAKTQQLGANLRCQPNEVPVFRNSKGEDLKYKDAVFFEDDGRPYLSGEVDISKSGCVPKIPVDLGPLPSSVISLSGLLPYAPRRINPGVLPGNGSGFVPDAENQKYLDAFEYVQKQKNQALPFKVTSTPFQSLPVSFNPTPESFPGNAYPDQQQQQSVSTLPTSGGLPLNAMQLPKLQPHLLLTRQLLDQRGLNDSVKLDQPDQRTHLTSKKSAQTIKKKPGSKNNNNYSVFDHVSRPLSLASSYNAQWIESAENEKKEQEQKTLFKQIATKVRTKIGATTADGKTTIPVKPKKKQTVRKLKVKAFM